MAKTMQNEYLPTIVFPPGETLAEELEARQMTPTELADQMGYPLNTIAEIIIGRGEITPEIAIQLERVLGVSANFWNNYERGYREWLAKNQVASVATSLGPGLFSWVSSAHLGLFPNLQRYSVAIPARLFRTV